MLILVLFIICVVGALLIRKGFARRYSHVFEHIAEQEVHQEGAPVQPKARAGISREQLKRLYESGLISKEEYKAGLKKQ